VDVGLRIGQANGLGVGDEMDLVTALSQFHAKLRRHHTAAAVRGIARDPNAHLCSLCLLHSMATAYQGFRFYAGLRSSGRGVLSTSWWEWWGRKYRPGRAFPGDAGNDPVSRESTS